VKKYFAYIMTNRSKTLYTGVTNDFEHGVIEHKKEQIRGVTSRYHIKKLVYFKSGYSINEAISREKVIKGWLRKKKKVLIKSLNLQWQDLSNNWYS